MCRRTFACSAVFLCAALTGCSFFADPIIGKWTGPVAPGVPVSIQIEFKADGTAAYDLSALEAQIQKAVGANPIAKAVVDKQMGTLRSAKLTWKKKDKIYALTTVAGGRTNTGYLTLQGANLTPCDEKGTARSGAQPLTRAQASK